MTIIDTLREFRIWEYAIFDLVVSFLGVYIIAPVLSRLFSKVYINISRRSRLLLTLPLSVLIHIGVGSMTTMTRDVIDIHSHYGIKIIMIICIVLWCRDISLINYPIRSKARNILRDLYKKI